MADKVTFIGALSDCSGNLGNITGGGLKVVLETSEMQKGNTLPLWTMMGKRLKITVELDQDARQPQRMAQ